MIQRLTFILAVLCFTLCTNLAIANPGFQGAWVGDWSGGGNQGRIYATISATGVTRGVVLNTARGDWGELTGTVTSSGIVQFAISYSRDAAQSWTGSVAVSLRNLRLGLRQTAGNARIACTLRADPFRGVLSAPANTSGQWVGRWTSMTRIGGQRIPNSGTAAISVLPNGEVNGTVTQSNGSIGIFVGRITPQGDMYGEIQSGELPPDPMVARFVPSPQSLSAPFVQLAQGGDTSNVVNGTLTLTSGDRLPGTGSDRILGVWTGSWRMGADGGTMSITVRENGVLSGTLVNARSPSVTGSLSGTVTSLGNFNLTVVLGTAAPASLSGRMELAGARVIGTINGNATMPPGSFSLQRRP